MTRLDKSKTTRTVPKPLGGRLSEVLRPGEHPQPVMGPEGTSDSSGPGTAGGAGDGARGFARAAVAPPGTEPGPGPPTPAGPRLSRPSAAPAAAPPALSLRGRPRGAAAPARARSPLDDRGEQLRQLLHVEGRVGRGEQRPHGHVPAGPGRGPRAARRHLGLRWAGGRGAHSAPCRRGGDRATSRRPIGPRRGRVRTA